MNSMISKPAASRSPDEVMALVQLFRPRLRRFVAEQGRTDSTADEICAEVVDDLMAGLFGGRLEVDSASHLRALLKMMAANRVIESVRKHRRLPPLARMAPRSAA